MYNNMDTVITGGFMQIGIIKDKRCTAFSYFTYTKKGRGKQYSYEAHITIINSKLLVHFCFVYVITNYTEHLKVGIFM